MTDRDKARLSGVHPTLITRLISVMADMSAAGTPMFVIQGVRTQAEQEADYLQGRDSRHPGAIITYCDGTTHKGPHQPHADGYGYAVDLAFVPSKDKANPFDKSWPWEDFGDALESHALIWGGRFHNGHMGDLDHAELAAPQGTLSV